MLTTGRMRGEWSAPWWDRAPGQAIEMGPDQQRAFAVQLRRHREAAGLTQEALAERAGLSTRAIAYLERGTHTPYRDTVVRLADALALAPQDRATLEAAIRPGSVAAISASPDRPRTTLPAQLTPPTERTPHDRAVAAARTALGECRFVAAWAAGQALPLEQAIVEVLEASRGGHGHPAQGL